MDSNKETSWLHYINTTSLVCKGTILCLIQLYEYNRMETFYFKQGDLSLYQRILFSPSFATTILRYILDNFFSWIL